MNKKSFVGGWEFGGVSIADKSTYVLINDSRLNCKRSDGPAVNYGLYMPSNDV